MPIKMPTFEQAFRGIGKGIAGLFPQTSTTETSGSSTTNSGTDTNANYNTFQNSDISSLLNTLLSVINQQQTSGTSTTTPNLSPATQQFLDRLTERYSSTALAPFNAAAYEAGQAQGINRNAKLAKQAAANSMAARGLAFSPAAATTDAGIDAGRFQQLQQLSSGIPLLSNEQNLKNLGAAAQFLNLIPKGSTTATQGTAQSTQQQTGQQQQQQIGSQTAGGTSYNQTTGYQNTNSQQTQKQKGGGGLGGFLSGLFGG